MPVIRCFSCVNIFFDPVITSGLYWIYLKEGFELDAAASWGISSHRWRPHEKSALKHRGSERNHTSEEEQRGGGLSCSVLICIWSCDVWGEGWISKSGGPERDTRSRVSVLRGPLESNALKLPLFDWEPEKESKREEEESERLLVRSEWASEAAWAPSPSLSLSLTKAVTQERDNCSLDLSLPSLKMTSR